MGSDDLFKKRREARKKRSHEFKTPKANSYLGFIGIYGKTDCIQLLLTVGFVRNQSEVFVR